MRKAIPTIASAAVGAFCLLAPAMAGEGHKLITPQDMTWGAAPPSLPPGAQAVVLYGDPGKEGMFALRLKFPKGYGIPPHRHPTPEVVTVISGSLNLGMGDTADRSKATALPTGGVFTLSPGTTHFGFADEDTVVQINTTGPWDISYVNPKDDPRQKSH